MAQEDKTVADEESEKRQYHLSEIARLEAELEELDGEGQRNENMMDIDDDGNFGTGGDDGEEEVEKSVGNEDVEDDADKTDPSGDDSGEDSDIESDDEKVLNPLVQPKIEKVAEACCKDDLSMEVATISMTKVARGLR